MVVSYKYDKIIRRFYLLCVVFFLMTTAHTQSTESLTHQVLQRISSQQTNGNKYFSNGIMPTYRGYDRNLNNMKPDNTAFTTGVIIFILNNLRHKLSAEDKIICDSIAQRAYPSFKKFKNQKGRNTYNFWQTDTLNLFPNSGWSKKFIAKKSLPDDLDDTVMLLMALAVEDSIANNIHLFMQNFINTKNSTVNNTFKEFKYIKAYSTWFGKKMPVDFDVCVMANILYFTRQYHIPFSAADSASLYFITKVLDKKYHITDAEYVAPNYGSTSLILYHLARLMAMEKPVAALEKYRPQLIEDAKKCFANATSITEKMILQTTLMRLGVTTIPPITIDYNNLFRDIENNDFIYFIANMSSFLKNPYKRLIGNTRLVKYNYYCPAYNDVLFLENLLISVK